jgi:hypothetical protein
MLDLGSFGKSALSRRGEAGVVIEEEDANGDICVERDKFDGFRGTVGDNGDLIGDVGLLMSVSIDVGMGVLDGL